MKRSTIAWLLYALAVLSFVIAIQMNLPSLWVLGMGILMAAVIIGMGEHFPL